MANIIQGTIGLDTETGELSSGGGDPRVWAFIEQRLGAHPLDKPAALAEEIVDAKTNAGDGYADFALPSLRDIAVAVSYGVLAKEDALKASRRLLERADLVDAGTAS